MQTWQEDLLQLFRVLINTGAIMVFAVFCMNGYFHSQGQVVPETMAYLVPLGTLLVLKIKS